MRAMFKNLTPRQAFYKYSVTNVERPVEFFLSNFILDGYTDLTAMCKTYAREVIEAEHGLATTEEIAHLAELFEQYIRDYVKKIGGVSKLKLYTEEECDAIFEREAKATLDAVYSFIKQRIGKPLGGINRTACFDTVSARKGLDLPAFKGVCYNSAKQK